jgi:GNAT superfamily N-acetyltransferase
MSGVTTFEIRPMVPADVENISRAFAPLGWPGKDADLYLRYLSEQDRGSRSVQVAATGTGCLGYITVLWASNYAPFRGSGIPEISDLNVLPLYRRQHIGTALMDAAESVIAARSAIAGLGVGLYADYAAAHRMYLQRGYLPDGKGIAYEFRPVAPGTTVRVDDELNLMMTRRLIDVSAART